MEEVFYTYARPFIEAAVRNSKHFDQEEAMAEANLIYARAQASHRPGRGTFAKHLRFKLKKGLVESVRDDARQRHGLRRDKKTPCLTRVGLADVPAPGDWTDQLSDNALAVAKLALRLAGKPATVRARLRGYLLELGWCASQVAETFKEIADALP